MPLHFKMRSMKYFAVSYDYNPNNPEIAKARPAHREFTAQLFEAVSYTHLTLPTTPYV